jgi:hypothetical protein
MTFPGIVVHEFAHKLFCQWTKTRVIEVCYFRIGLPPGYVIHESPRNVWKHILIDIAPFFVNTFIGFTMGLLLTPIVAGNYAETNSVASFFMMLYSWLAWSITMYAFPSFEDAEGIQNAIWQKTSPISARILGSIIVILICIGALGSVFWLNVFYAVFIVSILPLLLAGTW